MPTVKEEMSAIDRRKHSWYSKLSEEEQKSLSMWVIMRYCSSTDSKVSEINEHYLMLTNELVNVHFNDLRHHPELQLRLMQCVGIGSDQYHSWIKPGKRKKGVSINTRIHEFFLTLYPHLNDDEISIIIAQMGENGLKEILANAGVPANKVKDYLK
jgi:hypothetical protein